MKHLAAGEDVEAEELLRRCVYHQPPEDPTHFLMGKTIEHAFKPHAVLVELLQRKGTEEALAEATTLSDEVMQQLVEQEGARVRVLEETRVAAAEAVRQWREERIRATGKKKGRKGKGKGKKKGGKGKKKGRKGKGKDKRASCLSAIDGKPPHEPAGGEAEGAAAAEAEQQTSGDEKAEEKEEESTREECAICLQDLELDDDEDLWEGGEGEALVVLRCGHRFHAICGDMWCTKCANKGWGVTCPACRAPYLVVRE
jgi:hypothetical protein